MQRKADILNRVNSIEKKYTIGSVAGEMWFSFLFGESKLSKSFVIVSSYNLLTPFTRPKHLRNLKELQIAHWMDMVHFYLLITSHPQHTIMNILLLNRGLYVSQKNDDKHDVVLFNGVSSPRDIDSTPKACGDENDTRVDFIPTCL